jgi:DNA-binding XRE family transcriptional regulator
MKRDWLWDRKVPLKKVKAILKGADNPGFISYSALLLARKNTPKEVFNEYIKPLAFCKNWNRIKRQMRKDRWNEPRIEFWQHVYEVLLERYKNEGVLIRKANTVSAGQLCADIGKKVREIRKKEGLTQVALAEKIGISQQIISRIEKGIENISLSTLKRVADGLGVRIGFDFVRR